MNQKVIERVYLACWAVVLGAGVWVIVRSLL